MIDFALSEMQDKPYEIFHFDFDGFGQVRTLVFQKAWEKVRGGCLDTKIVGAILIECRNNTEGRCMFECPGCKPSISSSIDSE